MRRRATFPVAVERRHIAEGACGCGHSCAVALALVDAGKAAGLPPPADASVPYAYAGPNFLRVGDRRCDTPAEVAGFMDRFDDGMPTDPFSFTFDTHPSEP